MNFTGTKNITPRECQRRLFIDSLYKELDKIAEATESKNSNLMKRASELLIEEGLPKDSCVDVLIMEGYDDVSARNSVEAAAISLNVEAESSSCKYDYCFEDHRGRMFTGKELGEMITASSDQEAEILIKEALEGFDPPVNLVSFHKES